MFPPGCTLRFVRALALTQQGREHSSAWLLCSRPQTPVECAWSRGGMGAGNGSQKPSVLTLQGNTQWLPGSRHADSRTLSRSLVHGLSQFLEHSPKSVLRLHRHVWPTPDLTLERRARALITAGSRRWCGEGLGLKPGLHDVQHVPSCSGEAYTTQAGGSQASAWTKHDRVCLCR